MSAYDPIAILAELETAGVSRKQAEAITGAVTNGRADLVTKADLEAGLSGVNAQFAGVNAQFAGIKAELLVIRADFNAALNAMAMRLFLAISAVMALSISFIGVLIEIHK